MLFLLRVLQFILKIMNFFLKIPKLLFRRKKPQPKRLPTLNEDLLMLRLHEISRLLESRQVTIVHLVTAYIDRIKEVNGFLNAVVQDRFDDALYEARFLDDQIEERGPRIRNLMFSQYPLLGIPFTVKEACGVIRMQQNIGINRYLDRRCNSDSEVVLELRKAGAIPLLISTNPEFSLGIETYSYMKGRTFNPYDFTRTAGGSSGGEAALNAAGASLFGIGSDMDGSIRIPCFFNGVFGHKPTAGLTSTDGHFPNCDDLRFNNLLQYGIITRFASDIPRILSVIVDKEKYFPDLGLDLDLDITDIKIFYSYGFTGINGLLHETVQDDITTYIDAAVQFFTRRGLQTTHIDFEGFRDSLEISLSTILRIEGFPHMLSSTKCAFKEFIRSNISKSDYTKQALWFDLLYRCYGLMTEENVQKYSIKANALRADIITTLEHNGVLFFPTFPMTAFSHNTSLKHSLNIDYTMLFNALGLPATHVTMGLSREGLPTGFQVIACPHNDYLCLNIAIELENSFGGWIPPMRCETSVFPTDSVNYSRGL